MKEKEREREAETGAQKEAERAGGTLPVPLRAQTTSAGARRTRNFPALP